MPPALRVHPDHTIILLGLHIVTCVQSVIQTPTIIKPAPTQWTTVYARAFLDTLVQAFFVQHAILASPRVDVEMMLVLPVGLDSLPLE